MSYITTFTGKHFDPIEIDTGMIDLRDIAHALSLLCRANGHVRHFYSVAQHSINCCHEAAARSYSKDIQLACLLHDAAEAYLSDVTRPVKAGMPEYQKAEDRLLDEIWKKYLGRELSADERRIVFEIDDDMLSFEFCKIMPEKISDRYKKIKSSPKTEYESPESTEKIFIETVESLLP